MVEFWFDLQGEKGQNFEILSAPNSSDDTQVLCLKKPCVQGDIECLLNHTRSIQWLHVMLPNLRSVDQPIVILTLHTAGHSVYPRVAFSIERGNHRHHFDVVIDPGKGGVGMYFVHRPRTG